MPTKQAPAAPPAPATPAPKSALNSRPVRPAAAPASAAELLPDDPNEVPSAQTWTRPAAPPPGQLSTQGLDRLGETVARSVATALREMQQTAKRATGSLSGQAYAGVARTASLRLPGFRRFWWCYLLFLAGGVGAFLTAARIAANTWDDVATRLQYGAVRTSHMTVFFGVPDESPTAPSVITAVNDHGTARIFVLPGGQGTHASYAEVQINGDPDGKVPLLLQAVDVDRDGHPDLLVQWGQGGPINTYLFDTGKMSLRPPTAEEQPRLYLPTPGAGQ